MSHVLFSNTLEYLRVETLTMLPFGPSQWKKLLRKGIDRFHVFIHLLYYSNCAVLKYFTVI